MEQLRAATGFEAWLPTEPDVAALKDASQKLDQSLWADESGPPPPARDQLGTEADFEQDVPMFAGDRELTAALALAPTPPVAPATSPTTPSAPLRPQTNVRVEMHDQSFNRSDTLVYQPTVQNTFVRNTARLGEPSQGLRRGTSLPRTPRATSAPWHAKDAKEPFSRTNRRSGQHRTATRTTTATSRTSRTSCTSCSGISGRTYDKAARTTAATRRTSRTSCTSCSCDAA